MKVLAIYDHSGPKYHRVLLPAYLMDGIELIVKKYITEEDVKDVDIVFFNRLIPGPSIDDVIRWQKIYGFKTVIDFDDHWNLGKDHYLYEIYQKYRASEFMEAWITSADVVFVTHERLYRDVFPLNKNVHILPNSIPEFDQFLCKKIPSEQTRLFWAGGITHRNDLNIIKRPLQLIKKKDMKFVLGGYVKGNQEWDDIKKIFTTNNHQTEVIESLPVEEYYQMYSNCDIALIPLLETKFNSYKSNLKILESANIAAPVIVSRVHPYLDFPEELVNYVDGHNPWFKQITKLLNAPGEAIYQGEKLREYCREFFNFRKINEQRKQILEYEAGK